MLNIHEIELNTAITSIQNSITQTEARLMRIRSEQKRIKEAVSQAEEGRSQALVANSESSLQPPSKLASLQFSPSKCSSQKIRAKAVAVPYSHSTQRRIV